MSSFDAGAGFDSGYFFDDAGQPIPVSVVGVQTQTLVVSVQAQPLVVEVQAP